MTTDTLTLTQFLLERIAEDEAIMNSVLVDDDGGGSGEDPETWHWVKRARAERAAFRAIVVGHSPLHVCVNIADDGQTDYSDDESDLGYAPCPTLRALAAVYADHPAFNPDWS